MKKVMYWAMSLVVMASCKETKERVKSDVDSSVTQVRVETVSIGDSSCHLRYSGTIEAFRTIPLSFQSSGTVETVLVDAGDKVTKGQLLATTEKSNAQNMYDISVAKHQQAKDAYDRLKKVHDQGSLADIKWVEMETNLEQAKSSLALSKEQLEKCNLRAPSDGFVGKRAIEPGMSSISISGSPLELVEINDVYVKISVPENEISKLQKKQKVQIVVSALDGKTFVGEIVNLSPIADAVSRTYTVKALIHNTALELKPGMVCDVSISIDIAKNGLFIPYQSVSKDIDDKAFVYVCNNSTKRVRKQVIEIGGYAGSRIEVRSGLSLGQIIVVEGKEKLADNTLICF